VALRSPSRPGNGEAPPFSNGWWRRSQLWGS